MRQQGSARDKQDEAEKTKSNAGPKFHVSPPNRLNICCTRILERGL